MTSDKTNEVARRGETIEGAKLYIDDMFNNGMLDLKVSPSFKNNDALPGDILKQAVNVLELHAAGKLDAFEDY